MTQTSRRAEAMGIALSNVALYETEADPAAVFNGQPRQSGLMQNITNPTPLRNMINLPGIQMHQASESPVADLSQDGSSPDMLKMESQAGGIAPSMVMMPHGTSTAFLQPGFTAPQPSSAGRLSRQSQATRLSPGSAQGSPIAQNASPEGSDHYSIATNASNASFANLGDIRLAHNARLHNNDHHLSHQTTTLRGGISIKENDVESYFPIPGGAPIRPSMAITPGAVMISHLNRRGGYNNGLAGGILEESYDNGLSSGRFAEEVMLDNNSTALAPTATAAADSIAVPVEGENIAAFAAALKGGQSSTAVRSALTNQPILVRRATYIPGWSQAPRVLLVEDDLVCRNLTTKFLQLFGCTIEVAADGVEAVNKMQTGVYDICMMDISLPNMDGVSATSLIRQFDAMTPIISMTGNSRPDEVLTYFSHGMNDCLPKPFTKEGMLSMLEKHLLHLKQIHANPDMAPDNNVLDKFDPENYDPSFNPFFTFGLSNEEFQNIVSGTMTGVVKSPSSSVAAGGAGAGATPTPPLLVRGSNNNINSNGQQQQQQQLHKYGPTPVGIDHSASSPPNAASGVGGGGGGSSSNKRARFHDLLS